MALALPPNVDRNNINLEEWKSHTTSSGFKGVYFHKHTGRWQAGSSGGCTGLLGYYDTPEEAAVVFAKDFIRLKTYGGKRKDPETKFVASPPRPRVLKKKKTLVSSPQQEELFCVCRAPYSDEFFYLGCDDCGGWFHPECLGMDAEMARVAASLPRWECQQCLHKTDSVDNVTENWMRHALPDDVSNDRSYPQMGEFAQGVKWLYVPTAT